MPVEAPRPDQDATVALAYDPGEAADLLAVRTAQAAALRREEPVVHSDRLPITRVSTTTFDNDAQPGGRSAQTPNAGAVHPVRRPAHPRTPGAVPAVGGEDPCAP